MAQRKPGKKSQGRVTLKVLAEHLGLSPTTVSLVLNDSPVARSIPRSTRDRVLQAARDLNYRPDLAARSLRRKRSFLVGVLVSEISGGYSSGVMSGIEDALLRAGYFGLVASHQFDPDRLRQCLDLFRDRAVEGYILVNTPLDRPPDLPAVAVSGHRGGDGAGNIVIDHEKAADLALAYLKDLGHRRIAFTRGPGVIPDSEDRWRAIRAAARRLRIPVREELVFRLGDPPADAPLTLERFFREGYELGHRLVQQRTGFTALFAFNDPLAIGAMKSFTEAGLRIPRDLSVIGFDDIDSAPFQSPALTTIRQPFKQMGMLAAETLLGTLTGVRDLPEQVQVEPELVVRESCGPPAGA